MTKYAVVDVETTGLGSKDRIVEIAVVVIDHESRQVVDEFDTLVQPGRDVGPTHVHGISASMVEAAPTFADIAGSLARVLGGSILVAHNLPFDRRFVIGEFAHAGVTVEPGVGICTLRWTGERLDLACQRHGIELSDHHRALADARATAGLLLALLDRPVEDPAGTTAHARTTAEATGAITPVSFTTRLDPGVPRSLRRGALTVDSGAPAAVTLRPSRFRVRYPSSDEAAMGYLNIVDAFLDDLVLDDAERSSLNALAEFYGLDRGTCDRLHRDYLTALIAAAHRDGIISDGEVRIIQGVATALGVADVELPLITQAGVPGSVALAAASQIVGRRICFTGSAVVNGRTHSRAELESVAASAGAQPVSAVSRRGCDLLVAADVASQSAKAVQARHLGIPLMSVADFLAILEH